MRLGGIVRRRQKRKVIERAAEPAAVEIQRDSPHPDVTLTELTAAAKVFAAAGQIPKNQR
jgi:hypothetical protein